MILNDNKSNFDENDIIWLIPKARHLLLKRIKDKLENYNITWAQLANLSIIYNTEGCNQKKIAEISVRDGAAITRTLNKLESKKLVKRVNSPNDKREFLLYLTDEGYKLYNEAAQVIFKYNQEIVSIYTNSELKQLKELIHKLNKSLE